MKFLVTALLVAPVLAATTATSHANPRPLPFTYTTDTLPAGGVEVEQYVDLEPLRAQNPISGDKQWYLPSAFLTEIEIGIADRLELGLYMTIVPDPGEQLVNKALFPGEGSGLKQRLRYIFADPDELPVDVGVYGELTETEREVEFEGKLLLQKRFDRVRVAANISSEYELYFSEQREFVLNPSLGVTYEVSPKLHLGLDSWLRGEYPMNPKPASRTFGLGPETYVGPAVMTNFGKIWWAVGAYVRVSDFSHELQPGEPYGPIYFRSMIGYDL
ncbi:MAG TPA: hypothetical protein VH165_15575 [Kofleriaceae bacterium]|jgi:hypothetical protein|nr:hypothetical protein [Kofleriaceae bacterium]